MFQSHRRPLLLGILVILLAVFVSVGSSALAQPNPIPTVPAFPGAEGFGANSIGGRGGTVIEVTNLNDSGPGSFRAAVEASGPRIVVFKVGGTIELQSALAIANSYITIAGQTAPGDGITLKYSGEFNISGAHDVIIRYIRFRADGLADNTDALNIVQDSYNVILDHVSISWGTDENLSAVTRSYDITIQWSVISEGLRTGYGSLFTAGARNISIHHSLYANNNSRTPKMHGETAYLDGNPAYFDFVNNVIYNWGAMATSVAGAGQANVVANYFKMGPNSPSPGKREITIWQKEHGRSLYAVDNVGPNNPDGSISNSWDAGMVGASDGSLKTTSSNTYSPNPHPTPAIYTTSAFDAFDDVIGKAGASLARDSVDQRVIQDVINGTGGYINDPLQVGGWPALASGTPPADSDNDGMPDNWEIQQGLNPNDALDGVQDADNDGYTNVEEYLNALVPTDGVIDTTPPEAPTSLSATALSPFEISLNWQPAIDLESGVTKYIVYRNGSFVGESQSPSFSEAGLQEATSYTYEVSAVNFVGLESLKSSPVSITTLADIVAPKIDGVIARGDSTKVLVIFSEQVELSSATNQANYSIDNGIIASSAVLELDLRTVTLTTSTLADGVLYTITVNGVLDRALSPNMITPNSQTSFSFNPRITSGLMVLYEFEEGSGTIVRDVSGVGVPLDLTVATPTAVSWVPGGLSIDSATIVKSAGAATKVINGAKATDELSIETWVKPANAIQGGPARIVTLSSSTSERNFTLGPHQDEYHARLRTTATSSNGTPAVVAPGAVATILTQVVYTRDISGVAIIYIDGVEQTSSTVGGDFSNWNENFQLAIADELDRLRPWLGEIHLLAIYDRALSAAEVVLNYNAGANFGSSPPPTVEPTPSPVPTLPGMNAPAQDLDGDGLAEDINGNGRLDFADVTVLYDSIDSPAVQDNWSAFDFDGDGLVNMGDVTELFGMLVK